MKGMSSSHMVRERGVGCGQKSQSDLHCRMLWLGIRGACNNDVQVVQSVINLNNRAKRHGAQRVF